MEANAMKNDLISTVKLAGGVLALAVLAACSKPVETHEDIRPVRTMTVAAGSAATQANYSGDVRARREVKLGFRIGGKIVERYVEMGQTVKEGQPLMRLDPQDVSLQAAASQSQVLAAKAQLVQAKQDLDRSRQLLDKAFVSQAEVDKRIAAYDAAAATLKAAESTASVAGNQQGYTVLKAVRAGVVTMLEGEVGQVVAAGTPVAGIAEDGEREVVISVPESRVAEFRKASKLSVVLWANPGKVYDAQLREFAASADSMTRTYAAKVSILNPDDAVRLGMTANVSLSVANAGAGSLTVPVSAVYQQNGVSKVWVVDSKSSTVSSRPVKLGEISNEQIAVDGVNPGDAVVTAGAHLLHEQQKVRLAESQLARK